MSNNIKQAKDLLNAVSIMINTAINNLKFNKKKKAVIVSLNIDGTADIKINDEIFENIKIRTGLSPVENEVVWVEIPNNNINEMYIDTAQTICGTSDYTELSNKPVLKSDNTTTLSTSSSETISGTINVHKIAKTGSYDDLNNKPSIPSTLSQLSDDSTHRLVTDTEKNTWNSKQNALGFTPENVSNKGIANGYAELDATGKVPTNQLPSYVDDVLEYDSQANFPLSGETGKIYVTKDTNKTYRWSGSDYVEISQSLALGETSTTAYRGDKGKIAYDHSQISHAPSDAQKNSDITKAEIEAKLTGTITTHSHTNDHTHSNRTALDLVSGTNTGDETTTTIGGLINGATAKTTPIDADMIGLMDSGASNVLKKLSWSNIKATLKTYFDGLYALVGHNHNLASLSEKSYNSLTDKPTFMPADGGNADTVDGQHLNQDVRSTASPSFNNLSVARYYQSANGIPSSNLGNPSVTEMALFDSQFDNKTWFYPPTMFTFEYTDDGINWITQSVSESQIKNFVSGYANASIYIPNGCKQYRIRIDNKNTYVYINALYMYFSTSGNNTKVKISKKRDDGDWVQHTNSEQTVSSWPGHLYLPFSTIPWSRASTSGHYRYIEILFIPNWNHATNNIALSRLELWGGYPAGSRSLFSWDGNRNATFPAELKASTFKNNNNEEVAYKIELPTKLSQLNKDVNFDERYYTETESDVKYEPKNSNIQSHISNTLNPHNTTKSQVGLGSVNNYDIATQAEAEAGTSGSKYMTPQRTKQAIDALQAVKSVAGKTGAVTLSKADVGLDNVENKSSATIRGEITSSNVTTALGYTPAKKYATDIGDGSATAITVNHNLNTMDVTVLVRENVSPYSQVITDVQIVDANKIKLLFATAPSSGQYRVVVTG